MTMHNIHHSRLFHQQGAALIMSLVILLTLTILGVGALRTANLEESMAGNMRDANYAFQATETAMRAAEFEVQMFTVRKDPSSDCSTGICDFDATFDFDANAYDIAWWAANGAQNYLGGAGNLMPDVDSDPVFIREFQNFEGDNLEYGNEEGKDFYRTTVRGVGLSSHAISVVQSTYAKRRFN